MNLRITLYIMPDVIHIFKNVATALLKHKVFYMDEQIVHKYNLPSNTIDLEAIENVFHLEENLELKVAPRLKEFMFNPTHFDKMNVNLAFAMFNNDTAAAITYYISINKLNSHYQTTSWFCKTLFHWFSLMSARHQKMGISYRNITAYDEIISFFQNFMDIIRGMKIRDTWQPFQSGMLLATQTALDLQEEYLERENFKYLMLGRLTQDALENLFSMVRVRTPVPGPHDFKTALPLILLSQYEAETRGNYWFENTGALIKYCKELQTDAPVTDENYVDLIPIVDFHDYEEINSCAPGLYYLLGNILHKIQPKTCTNCYQPLLCNPQEHENNDILLLTKLKDYKENLLTYPSFELFEFIKKAEIFFKTVQHQMLNNEITVLGAAALFPNDNTFIHIDCHSIIKKIVNLFMRTRFFFALRAANRKSSKHTTDQTESCRSSRSIAMRSVLKQLK